MDTNGGNKVRSDMKMKHDKPTTMANGSTVWGPTTTLTICSQRWTHNSNKRRFGDWYSHHPQCQPNRRDCCYEDCPGRDCILYRKDKLREPRPFESHYKCIDCSLKFGKEMFFCNHMPRGPKESPKEPLLCFELYHRKYHCTDYESEKDDENA